MRWSAVALLGFLVLLLAAVGVDFLLTQASSRSILPLYEILTYEGLKPTPAELDDSDLKQPVRFDRIADVPYGPHGWRNCLDLYLPKQAERPMPIVLFIHGGGAANTSKGEAPERWMHALLGRGFAVAQNNYRVIIAYPAGSPNPHNDVPAPFPAQIQDCKAAIRFLRANAARYGLDPKRIGVMGHSFGGYLAALVGATGDAEEFDANGEHQEESSSVEAACVVNGFTDLRAIFHQQAYHQMALGYRERQWNLAGGQVANNDGPVCSEWLGGAVHKNLKVAERASPVTYVSSANPPFSIIQGFDDPVVPPYQADLLYVKLRNAGVDAMLQIIPGAVDGGPALNNRETRRIVAEFFERHLGKKRP